MPRGTAVTCLGRDSSAVPHANGCETTLQDGAAGCTSGRTNFYEPQHNQLQETYATAVYTVHSTPRAVHRSQDRFHGRPLPSFT